jgi:hypothetical protein
MQTESPLEQKLKRFAPTEITADVAELSAGDRQALYKLIQAARLMDEIFLRQVWSANALMKEQMAKDSSPEGKATYAMFMLNKSPWSATMIPRSRREFRSGLRARTTILKT